MQQFFQFIILMFIYSSTCFGRFPAYHLELNDCSGSLSFYLRIARLSSRAVFVVGPAEHSTTVTTIRRTLKDSIQRDEQQEGTHDSNTNRNTATCPNKVVTKTTRRTVALQQEQYPWRWSRLMTETCSVAHGHRHPIVLEEWLCFKSVKFLK
jgi:hypothetical protein